MNLKLITDMINYAIIFAGAVNLYLLFNAKRKISIINKKMHPINYKASKKNANTEEYSLVEMVEMRKSINKAYSAFSSFTALFTSFGIIGTVISLVLIKDNGNLSDNFGMALTSTLWGLAFFIVFRILDIFFGIECDCDEAEKSIEDYIKNKLDGEVDD